MTTFRVSDKVPEVFQRYGKDQKAGIDLFRDTKLYSRNHCTEPLQGSDVPSTISPVGNGFVHTVVDCYNGHHNLVLRPDDVWTSILVQFSFYLNKESEKFRSKFVSFEGKKELVVTTVGSLRTVSYDYLVNAITEKIHENLVDPEVKAWVLPNFSTTTKDDLVTCGVVLMATMKNYFDYKICLLCGIPSVTLEGTVEDWEKLLGRIEKLKEYELTWWYDLLKPILQEFLNSKKGKADTDFWNKVCSHHSGGSGPSYLSGWITAFCVFNEKGEKQGNYDGTQITWGELIDPKGPWPVIDTRNIPSGLVEVDVKIDDNGVLYHSVMFAGHYGREILETGKTLKPKSGWVICLKPSPEEIKRIEEEEEKKQGRYRRAL